MLRHTAGKPVEARVQQENEGTMLLRLAILVIAMLVTHPALAERKAALLIGNAAYSAPATELRNPPNDVAAMRSMLEGAGFEVMVVENAGRAAMSQALAAFEEKVAGAEIGLIYYSGHGIEVNGDNFLVPVDARFASDRDVKYEAILLDDLLHALAGATRLKLVLLDACRDNPFLRSMKRQATRGIPARGLARVESAESNMLIGYATAPGDVALDGDGDNSPYAQALVRHLVTPGLEIEAALRAVAKDVFDATGGRQRPFKTGSLFETVMLGNAEPAAAANLGRGDPCRDAAAHWNEIRDLGSRAMFEDHIRLFPGCAFANLARHRMGSLADEIIRSVTAPETECDRLAAADNDSFKLASVKGVHFSGIDSARAIPACRAAIEEYPSEIRFPYQYARALDQAGHFEEALVQYRKAAELGNAHAMRNLAILYENGQGTARDYGEAMLWFRKAADLGNGLAMNNIGVLYRFGRGVEQDFAAALEWYHKAADRGVTVAMRNIGDFHHNAFGVKQDYEQALAWYRKSADAGDVPALTSIGYAYEMGYGVKQDFGEALSWYRKAAEKGNAQAINNIGTFYEKGRAVPQDYNEALSWYRRAAEKGNGYGAHNAAVLIDKGRVARPDPKEAARLLVVALRANYEPSLRQMKENAAGWSPAVRRELQQRLTEAGVYSGKIDGRFGPSTIRAIEAVFGQKES